jgi:hypothetical protein
MTSEMFSSVSAFYIDLWKHVDAFSDEHRWLHLTPIPDLTERMRALKAGFTTLHSKLQAHDPMLAAQVASDLEEVQTLTHHYIAQQPQPGSPWFRQAAKMSTYLQELGLRYAELASAREGER